MDNVLVIQMARMGDFLQTTPLLRGLKHSDESACVTVLVDSRNRDLAGCCPDVDHVLCIDEQTLCRAFAEANDAIHRYAIVRDALHDLRALHADTVINVNYSPVSMLLASLAGASKSYGYTLCPRTRMVRKSPWFAFFNAMLQHQKCAPFNLVDYFYWLCPSTRTDEHRTLRFNAPPEIHPVQSSAVLLRYALPENSHIIALQVGTRDMRREWKAEQFAVLADKLLTREQVHIILLGSQDDVIQGESILSILMANRCPSMDRVHNAVGKTTVAELARILGLANILITADTGAMHLAAAVDCRVLALFFSSAYAYHTAPYGEAHCIVQSVMPCCPCTDTQQNTCGGECRIALTPEAVYACALQMLPGASDERIPAFPSNAIFHTVFDDLGMVLQPQVDGMSCDEIRSRVYRHIGGVLLNMFSGGEVGYCDQRGWKGTTRCKHGAHSTISQAIASGAMVLRKFFENPSALHECRLDSSARVWHPWIDFYGELEQFCPEISIGMLHQIFMRGMLSGIDFLNSDRPT